MGVDCVFVAENRKKVGISAFERDVKTGKFPGGSGRFIKDDLGLLWLEQPTHAYCHVDFVGDLVVVGDGCRYYGQDARSHKVFRKYQLKMLGYLKKICGGLAGVWADNDEEIDEESTTAADIIKIHGTKWPPPSLRNMNQIRKWTLGF